MDYSNQDFIAKLNELLTMLKTMSSSYDPTVSSESDPIVVLLKEMGMSNDQINYLIDKAVGELMPSRVQQRANAQELYANLGYNIKKYQSSIGTISLRLKNVTNLTGTEGESGLDIIKIPKFTRIGDANGQFAYVTIEPITWSLDTATTATPVTVMEGVLKDLQVGGSSDIKLINLDENYRIYFTEKNVAENGIFVTLGSTAFTRKDNVYALTDTDVYYVGEGDDGEIYIQFPSSIITTLGNAGTLSIKYLVTNGVNGNCKAGTLTTVLDEITDKSKISITAKMVVSQTTAMTNGSDPESIDDMYRNFKKTQNQLETLVTESDYEGAAFLAESDRKPLWSNVVIGSRVNDLNQTIKIKKLESGGKVSDYYRLIDKDDIGEGIKVGTMFLYGLTYSNDFDTQFVPDIASGALTTFKSLVADTKAINQDIRDPQKATTTTDSARQLGFVNEFFLSGMILLKNSVSQSDADTIKANVMAQLKSVYSARKREFGSEIDYQEAVDTIVNSDSRIQTVAISIPKYQIKNLSASDNAVVKAELSDNRKTELIARMVLSGNIQLYKHDDRFSFVFGQKMSTPMENIVSLSTTAGNKTTVNNTLVDAITQTDGYTIKKNEVVQVKGNKYKTTISYGALVNYKFTGNGDITLSANKTLTQDAVLAAGSVATSGSTLILNIDGTTTATTTSAITLANESVLKSGTFIASGSTGTDIVDYVGTTIASDITLTAEAMLAVGSQIANGSTLVLGTDYTFLYGSGIKASSNLVANSIIKKSSTYEGETVGRKLLANVDNKLISGDCLDIKYNDGGVIRTVQYEANAIVRPSFDLMQTFASGDYPKTLATGESINIREQSTQTLSKGTLYCLAGRNTDLTIGNGNTYDMGDSEYLIYTSEDKDELVIINPHTVLKNNSGVDITLKNFSVLDVNNISSAEKDSVVWDTLKQDLTVCEQEVFTFAEGVTVKCDTALDNTWTDLSGELTATDSSNNTKSLYKELNGSSNDVYKARIILNIVAANEQKLEVGQKVTAGFGEITLTSNKTLTDAVTLASGSILKSGTFIASGSTGASITSYVGTTTSDITLSANAMLKAGSVIASGSTLRKVLMHDLILDKDITLASGSILKSGTVIAEDSTGTDIASYVGTTIASDITLTATATLKSDSVIKSGSYLVGSIVYESAKNIIFDTDTVALGGKTSNTVEGITVGEYENVTIAATEADGVFTMMKATMDSNSNSIELPFNFYAPSIVRVEVNATSSGEFTVKTHKATDATAQYSDLSMVTSGTLGDTAHPISRTSDTEFYQCLVPAGAKNIKITYNGTDSKNYISIGPIIPLSMDSTGTARLNEEEITVTAGGDYNDTSEDAYDLGDTTHDTDDKTRKDRLLAKIIAYDNLGKYDYGYIVPESKKVKQPTRSSSYWNPFHVGNKYTIAKMNLDKTEKGLIINPGQINS